jgi:hypothetical protein
VKAGEFIRFCSETDQRGTRKTVGAPKIVALTKLGSCAVTAK